MGKRKPISAGLAALPNANILTNLGAEPMDPGGALIIGDNLQAMRAMRSETVDLVYLDPPFNTGRKHHPAANSRAAEAGEGFNDRWDEPEETGPGRPRWLRIKGMPDVLHLANRLGGPAARSYLEHVTARIVRAHGLLKRTGSLIVHCDDRMVKWLELAADVAFGPHGGRMTTIIWQRRGASNAGSGLGRVCDHLLVYEKRHQAGTRNPRYTEYDEAYQARTFRHTDEHGRYATYDVRVKHTKEAHSELDSRKPWRGLTPGRNDAPLYAWNAPTKLPPWAQARLPEDYEQLPVRRKLDVLDDIGMLHWPDDGRGYPRFKHYAVVAKGVRRTNLWNDIKPVNAMTPEYTGYPTQKPVRLLEELILTFTQPGARILDPCAGAGTTAVAAAGTERQWIAIDRNPATRTLLRDRLAKEL